METQNDTKKGDLFLDESVLDFPISGTDSDYSSSSSFSTCSSSSADKFVPQKIGNRNNDGLQWKQMFHTIKKKSVCRFSMSPLITTYEQIGRKNMKKKISRIRNSAKAVTDYAELLVPKPSLKHFEYRELVAATDNFSSENLIGEGGNAKVYRGCLPDDQVVAVKQLVLADKDEEDRIVDFLSELGTIAHINHPNAVTLLGFSVDGGLHLVLEFLPHGCLASVLHGGADCLEWGKRFKVAVGIAEGLQYLHHECPRRIIHRDIKASNILLNEDYEAQISDFGLAKWLPENWIHHIVFPIEGTFGYLAPEYFVHGVVDEKTDVFAFGVLLLEIITGRRAVDSSRINLAMWAKPLLETDNVEELIDPQLGDDYDPIEMKLCMLTAKMCINHLSNRRLEMNQVVPLLKNGEVPIELKQKLNAGRTAFPHGCELQDYTCTSNLADRNRHMQLAME